MGAEGRPASQAGRRGTALVSVAVGSRGRVFLVARPCLRFLPEPPPLRAPGCPCPSVPSSPPAARRSSLLPERLTGLTSVGGPVWDRTRHRLVGGAAAGHWLARCPRPPARAFGTGSVAPRVGPGGLPGGCRGVGLWRACEGREGAGGPAATAAVVGGSRGERRGPVGRSGCRAGPPSRSEAAGGETPACVSRPRSAAPEGSRGVPFPAGRLSRAFPVASASPVVPRLLPARSSEPGRRVPRVRLASRACRGPPWRRPSRASASGRARPPRVALPRSARACARARPGGPSRTGVRAMCGAGRPPPLPGRSPFPRVGGWGPGRGLGPGRGPSSRVGAGGCRPAAVVLPWPSCGVCHPCARARRRGSEPGFGRAPGPRPDRCAGAAAARRDCPRAGRRGPPLARRPNVGAAPRGGRSAVPASPPPTGAGRARVRVAAGPSRARVGPSASSRAGATRKGLAGPWCEPGVGGGRWSCRVGGRVVGASGSPRPAPAPAVPAAAPRPLARSLPPARPRSVRRPPRFRGAGPVLARPPAGRPAASGPRRASTYLVDPASSICLSQRLSHACLSTHGRYSETANGSLNQLWFLWSLAPLLLG